MATDRRCASLARTGSHYVNANQSYPQCLPVASGGWVPINGPDLPALNNGGPTVGLTRAVARSQETVMIAKNTLCLWYDGTAEEASAFYAATFPDLSLIHI